MRNLTLGFGLVLATGCGARVPSRVFDATVTQGTKESTATQTRNVFRFVRETASGNGWAFAGDQQLEEFWEVQLPTAADESPRVGAWISYAGISCAVAHVSDVGDAYHSSLAISGAMESTPDVVVVVGSDNVRALMPGFDEAAPRVWVSRTAADIEVIQ